MRCQRSSNSSEHPAQIPVPEIRIREKLRLVLTVWRLPFVRIEDFFPKVLIPQIFPASSGALSLRILRQREEAAHLLDITGLLSGLAAVCLIDELPDALVNRGILLRQIIIIGRVRQIVAQLSAHQRNPHAQRMILKDSVPALRRLKLHS